LLLLLLLQARLFRPPFASSGAGVGAGVGVGVVVASTTILIMVRVIALVFLGAFGGGLGIVGRRTCSLMLFLF